MANRLFCTYIYKGIVAGSPLFQGADYTSMNSRNRLHAYQTEMFQKKKNVTLNLKSTFVTTIPLETSFIESFI